jgi:hypothetical protein
MEENGKYLSKYLSHDGMKENGSNWHYRPYLLSTLDRIVNLQEGPSFNNLQEGPSTISKGDLQRLPRGQDLQQINNLHVRK